MQEILRKLADVMWRTVEEGRHIMCEYGLRIGWYWWVAGRLLVDPCVGG